MRSVKILILIGLFVVVQAMSSQAQTKPMDLSKAPQNLTKLFSFIKENYGYRFFYSNDLVRPDQKVTLSSKEYQISDLIQELSLKTGLRFSIKENNLIVVEDQSNQPDVSGEVSGIVKDSGTGNSIPGVTILVLGTNEGMVTDSNGKFNLKVKNMNDTLMVSFIGYAKQKVPIRGKTSFEIRLAEDVKNIDEVVVTALNINRSKASLGYSISTVNGDDLNKAKENNVINSLAGTVAGLQISKAATGVDGSTRVILRGVSSINGNNRPLVVVDGIPVDASYGGGGRWGGTDNGDALSDINSEDIESMSILKGAGAAAAYGSRGANGVILIVTKKGRLKKGLGVSFSSNYSVENPLLLPEFQNTYGHGAFGTYPTSLPDVGMPWAWSYGPKMDGTMHPNFWGGTSAYSPQPNNYKDFFQTGTSLVNSIALESGNDVSTVRASITTQTSDGIMPLNDLNRQTFNLRGFTKLKDVIELDGKVTYMHSKVNGRPQVAEGNNNPGYMLSIMPRNMVNSELKDHQVDANGNELLWTTDGYTSNPYWQLYNNANNDEKNRLQGVLSTKLIFSPKLNFLLRSGIDYTNLASHSHTAKGSKSDGINGYISNNIGNSVEWNSDFLLSFDPHRESAIKYTASLGGNYRYNSDKGLSQSGSNLRINDYYAISNAASYGTDQSFSEKEVYSIYGLATGTYKNWLFLDFTLRNDWSSTLPVKSNSYMYYSTSLSFLFTDALHLKSSVLTNGKLRASVSKVGNDTKPYQTRKYFDVVQTQLPYPVGEFSDVLASTDLQPEITKSWEVGISLNLLKDLVNLDVTYYNNLSNNQIMDIPLPPGSGYESVRTNAAALSNKGIEVQVNVAPVRKDNFSWNFVATWSKNRSMVEHLYGNLESIVLDEIWFTTIQARPGMEYGEIYTTDFKRDSYGRKLVDNQGYVIKGDYKAVGNMNPDWMGGLSNNFKYKDFNLSFLIDVRKGGDVYSIGNAYRNLFGTSIASLQGRDDWYATHDPKNGYVTPLAGVDPKGYVEDGINENTGQKNTVSIDPLYRFYNVWAKEIGVENVLDATNVRMREASIGYSISRRILKKTFLTDVQISLVGRNLFFFYNAMKDIDPESGYSSGNTGGGFEHCAIPTTRSIGFNLKVDL